MNGITLRAMGSEMDSILGKAPKENPAIVRALKKVSPVVVYVNPKDKHVGAAGGGYYDQGKKIVVSTKDHHILAHEVGHAMVDQGLLGRIIQSKPMRLAGVLAQPAALIAGIGARTAKGKALAVAIPVLTTMPTLGSEIWASHKGHGLLEEHGATKKDLEKYKERMTKAFGTYTVLPIAAAVNAGSGMVIRRALS